MKVVDRVKKMFAPPKPSMAGRGDYAQLRWLTAAQRLAWCGGVLSQSGRAVLRTRKRDDGVWVPYAASIEARVDEWVAKRLIKEVGGYYTGEVWRVRADQQLRVSMRLLAVTEGVFADGLNNVGLFRMGQPRVKGGRGVPKDVMDYRVKLGARLQAASKRGRVDSSPGDDVAGKEKVG